MGSRAENDLYTTESFIKEPLSWGFEKDELCNDSAVQERRASEGVLIDDDKDWVQSPSLRRCSLVSERVQGSGKGSSTILTAGGEGGAAAGPHRRGFIAFGGESLCQLHVCSESDMRSETGNWIQLGQQVLKLEDLAQVPEHIESKAYEELGETPEVRKESLQQFKCMLDTQPCYLMKMLLNLVLSDMIPGLQKECSKVLMGNMDCLEHQVAHLKTVGGTSLTGAIINILKRTLTNDNDVAEVFSLLGRKTKNFKEYPLYKVVFEEREEHGLISPMDNDVILLSYLRAAHFNLDGAYKKMTDYYRFKQKYYDYCGNLLPQNECRAFQSNLLTVLPNRDKHGRRILVVQAGKKWDPSTCSVQELVRGVMMIVKAAILEPVTQISGAVVIIDVKELGYTQMKHLISLSLAEMLVHWVQDCFPTRLKAIHVVNINALFGMVLNVFKKFLNEKFQKRVIVHNKPDTLNIEKELLPKELGGSILELPENHGMLLHKLLCLYQDKYEQVSKYGYPKEPEKKERRGWF